MSERAGAGSVEKKDKQVVMELNILKLNINVKVATKIRLDWVRGRLIHLNPYRH